MSLILYLSVEEGYYPHFFNTTANEFCGNEMPGPKCFGVDFKTVDERSTFLEWHSPLVHTNEIFNSKDELRKYCKIDVEILRLVCVEFNKGFWKGNENLPIS